MLIEKQSNIRHLEHVSKVERRHTSFGILNIMDHYKANGIEYPEWLYSRFDQLPRSNDYENKFCIELSWLGELNSGGKSILQKHGEITIWIIENLEHKWYKRNKHFYFEDELDAMTFKLRWL